MTTQAYLRRVRRLLAEVDLAASDVTDPELLEATEDARRILELRKVSGMDAMVIGFVQEQPGYGIFPDPTDEQGEMLALQTAADMLDDAYRGRVSRGEIGTSWTSGLESESTIQQQKAYRDAIGQLRSNLEELKLIKRAPTAGTRPQ